MWAGLPQYAECGMCGTIHATSTSLACPLSLSLVVGHLVSTLWVRLNSLPIPVFPSHGCPFSHCSWHCWSLDNVSGVSSNPKGLSLPSVPTFPHLTLTIFPENQRLCLWKPSIGQQSWQWRMELWMRAPPQADHVWQPWECAAQLSLQERTYW